VKTSLVFEIARVLDASSLFRLWREIYISGKQESRKGISVLARRNDKAAELSQWIVDGRRDDFSRRRRSRFSALKSCAFEGVSAPN
jgi:hypothetical protein